MNPLLTATLILCTCTACSAQPAESDAPTTAPASQPAASQPAASQPATQPVVASQPESSQSQPDENSPETWLERIEAAAGDVTTLTAKLRYDRNQLLLGDEQRRFGTLVYQAGPPPMFEVHFDKKFVDGAWTQPDLYYIYDGQWLLKRDHENKTAVRYQLVPDQDDDEQANPAEQVRGQMELGEGPFPIPLNLKKDRVLEKFEVQVQPAHEDDPTNSVHLTLTPRENHNTDLTAIDLWFDRDTLQPTSVSTLDDSETQTVVNLSEIVTNAELTDKAFDTSLPIEPGWQIDENRIANDSE